MAAAVEITNSPIPDRVKLDGRNFLPAVRGETKESVHDMLFFAGQHCDFWGLKGPFAIKGSNWKDFDNRGNAPVGWAVRKGNLLLRYWGESKSYELYDVIKDPGESRNIYGDQYQKEIQAMKEAYRKWFVQMKEPVKMNRQKWLQLAPE